MRYLNKITQDDLVPIGRFGTPHGIKGEIKFRPYDGVEEFIWDVVSVIFNKGLRRLEVKKVRTQTGGFLITLDGVNQREEAALFTGLEVSVPESELPETSSDEYYYKDLEGLAVITDDCRDLGFITKVFSAGGGNDVFEVTGPNGEVLIPVTEETILEINLEEHQVKVHLLEGLLSDKD